MGVERIVATNAVGAINLDFRPGDLVVPHDLIDFTKLRRLTFYDEAPVTHIDVSQPYCPEVRALLIQTIKKHAARVWDQSVLVCTEGPRYETPAEIEMLRRLGCDIVGMTGVPEAVLARELEMCYATLCFVSNMAAGIQRRLTTSEVIKVAKEKMPIIQQILRETIEHLPHERRCACAHALRDARFRG
jgi:5'-methylthioadenosine phosphorylase